MMRWTVRTDRVVNDVGKGPSHGDGQEGKTEEDVVNESDDDNVCHPHALAVEVRRVGIRLAMSHAHIHLEEIAKNQQQEQ